MALTGCYGLLCRCVRFDLIRAQAGMVVGGGQEFLRRSIQIPVEKFGQCLRCVERGDLVRPVQFVPDVVVQMTSPLVEYRNGTLKPRKSKGLSVSPWE